MAISEVIASLTLPGVERSAMYARVFVRDVLGDRHPSLDDVQMCVNEAVTNAIEHSTSGQGGQVTVSFSLHGSDVIAEVIDDGAGNARPVMRNDLLAEDGRGLLIIEALALAWEVRDEAGRTCVRMRFPGPPPSVSLPR